MPDIQIPCFPVSERATLPELPQFLESRSRPYQEETGIALPAFILDPRPECKFTGRLIAVENAPERMLVITMEAVLQDATFRALEEVQKLEPGGSKPALRKMPRIKDNTPLKSVFRQMEENAITVFSLTMADETGAPSETTFFFLRTAFTIGHFRRLIMAGDPGPTDE